MIHSVIDNNVLYLHFNESSDKFHYNQPHTNNQSGLYSRTAHFRFTFA